MKQIKHIIQREFNTNVRNRSFILLSVLSPLLFVLPFIFGMVRQVSDDTPKYVGVVDQAGLLTHEINAPHKGFQFIKLQTGIKDAKELLSDKENRYLGILYIPGTRRLENDGLSPIKYYVPTDQEISSTKTSEIEDLINNKLLQQRLAKIGVKESEILKLKKKVKVYSILVQNQTSEARRVASVLAYSVGMLMYMMFILYNNALLRGIAEEKANRIVEVFSMVVDPFYFMIGKIVGLGLMALIQLVLWVSLLFLYLKIVNYIGQEWLHINTQAGAGITLSDILNSYKTLPIGKLLVFTPLFFVFGFLINGAITAMVAATASVRGESSLSILSNLINIASIYMAMFSAGAPESDLAQASIYIPFLSPIVLPALLPFDLPLYKILLSLAILILSFIGITFIAGKIYRISIITYGNKMSWQAIGKILSTGEA